MADLQTAVEARGLALPATRGPGGYFESKGSIDVAWGNLLNAILVPLGGRVMRRTYGSTIRTRLFEPVVDTALVRAAIRDVSNRLPDLTVTDVTFRRLDSGLQVVIQFRLNRDVDQTQTQQVLIPKQFVSPGVL